MPLTYEQRRDPNCWIRGMTWGIRYAYYEEWARLIAGTRKRYDWLVSRKRLNDDAADILH